MKRLLLTIAAGFLRLVYIPIRRRPVQRKVTIISRQSDSPSLDIRLLQQELAKHLRHPDRKERHDSRTSGVRPPGRMRQRQDGRLEEMLKEVVQGIHRECR